MNPETKVQSSGWRGTLGVVGAAAALVAGVTFLVLPSDPPAAPVVVLPAPHGEYLSWPYKYASELHQMAFEIAVTTDFQTWQVAGYALGTNIWFVPSNRPPEAFYTISGAHNMGCSDARIRQRGFE